MDAPVFKAIQPEVSLLFIVSLMYTGSKTLLLLPVAGELGKFTRQFYLQIVGCKDEVDYAAISVV